ncbi:hypothetical protein CsatB_000633 [Cannabis sativa]
MSLTSRMFSTRMGTMDLYAELPISEPNLPRHYSVKSAYRSLQEEKGGRHTSDNSGFWQNLWNLKVPPKVKNLLWSASAGCLPTKSQLQTKHVHVNDLFPLCNAERETISHVMITCSFLKASWNRLEIGVPTEVNGTFSTWLKEVYSRFVGSERRLISIVVWALWKCQNDLAWDNKNRSVREVVTLANIVLNQWQTAQDKTQDISLGFMNSEDGDEHWRTPNAKTIKVNTDVVIFEQSQCFSYSLVAQNHTGRLEEA